MAYELIETIEVGAGGAASIEFTSIPQDGVDLVVRASLRNTDSNITIYTRFNGDTGSNYTRIQLSGNGSSASSSSSSTSRMDLSMVAQSGSTANTFGNSEIYISNYTSATDKSVSNDGVNENNATTAHAGINAGKYTTTSPITSISLLGLGRDFVAGSTASLYKIS